MALSIKDGDHNVSFDSVQLGRNELCPCSSGKKYKKCCLLNPMLEGGEKKSKNRAAALLGRQRLLEKLKSDNMIVSPPIDSMPKISASIIELAKDMLDFAKNKSQRKIAITTACVAWNMAVLATNEDVLHDELNRFFATCAEERDQEDFTQLIFSMIEKKRLLFSDDIRLVVDFEIVDTRTYFSVNVASMLPTQDYKNQNTSKLLTKSLKLHELPYDL